MAGYDLGNNTTGFYKFDSTSDILKNSIITSNPLNVSSSNILQSNEKYYSRKYSVKNNYITPSSSDFRQSGVIINIPYNHPSHLLDYNIISTLFPSSISNLYTHNALNGAFTIDFWIYPKKKSTEGFGSRPILSLIKGESSEYNSYIKERSENTLGGVNSISLCLNNTGKALENNANVYLYFTGEFYKIEYTANTSSSPWNNFKYCNRRKIYNVGTVKLNDWNHIALMRSNQTVSVAINGLYKSIGKLSFSNCFLFNAIVNIGGLVTKNDGVNAYLNGSFYNANNYFTDWSSFEVGKELETSYTYIDNLRISNSQLWYGNFDPPGTVGRQIFIYDEYAYYLDTFNNITKLSFAKWNDISVADKLTLLDKVSFNDLPDADQIRMVQVDPSKDIICLNYQTDTYHPSIKIEKIDERRTEVVYPAQFMDYGFLQNYLVDIKATGLESATSIVRLALTRDGKNYFTYNATNSAWVPLDNKEDVITDGIILTNLKDIPKSAWIQFDLSRFAFSIALTRSFDSDSCQINDIKLTIDLDEKWIKANKETQAKYKYIGPTLLRITFLEDGKYIINYNDRG